MSKIDKSKYTKKHNDKSIYNLILITKQIPINIINVGSNIRQTLEKIISTSIEGKCNEEGYIKPKSTKILTYSSGLVQGNNIIFEVVFECLSCCPVEGMQIKCVAKNITKAGIKAIVSEESNPVVVFIARDHHYQMEYFSNVKEEEQIKIRVIGQRYELNDEYISVLGELIDMKKHIKHSKPKIVLED